MHTNHQLPPEGATYTGHDVIDGHGHHIGKVTDVIFDDASAASPSVGERPDQPAWLVVNPGVLRAAHYVPVAGSYRTEDGTVVVPWDKDQIKSAAKATGDHVLTPEQVDELATHYSLAQ